MKVDYIQFTVLIILGVIYSFTFTPIATFMGLVAYLLIMALIGRPLIREAENKEDDEKAHQEKTKEVIKFAFNETRNKQKKNRKYMVKPKREGKY